MKKIHRVPIKVIDNFFESPQMWRYFALKQEFSTDSTANFPGQKTKLLSELNVSMFHSVAEKLIRHMVGYTGFEHLELSFRIADASYGTGWIHHDDPKFNIVGLIYLNPSPPLDSGTIIYTNLKPTENNYQEYKYQEIASAAEDRSVFDKFKHEQQQYFKKNMTIHNVFNRCVIYSPLEWHGADNFFGSEKDDSRLTLNFFGRAI